MSEPDYWGRCDTCGDPLTEVGRIAVYSTGAGTLRFRFCDGDCKDRFQSRDVHTEFDRGELVTDGGTEVSDSEQEFPQVSSVEPTNGEYHIKVRRRPHLHTKFRLYDDELKAVIEHLRSLHTGSSREADAE